MRRCPRPSWLDVDYSPSTSSSRSGADTVPPAPNPAPAPNPNINQEAYSYLGLVVGRSAELMGRDHVQAVIRDLQAGLKENFRGSRSVMVFVSQRLNKEEAREVVEHFTGHPYFWHKVTYSPRGFLRPKSFFTFSH